MLIFLILLLGIYIGTLISNLKAQSLNNKIQIVLMGLLIFLMGLSLSKTVTDLSEFLPLVKRAVLLGTLPSILAVLIILYLKHRFKKP